jgi:RNA polymerase sigma-70 factor (ECF subfamily)
MIPEELIPDAAQEVCINLWQKRESLSDTSNTTSYMRTMVHNKLLDFSRQLKRTRKQMHAHAEKLCDCMVENDFTNPIWCNRLVVVIEDKIAHMPPQQQQVMACKWTGITRKEIAEKQEITLAAVDRNQQEGNKKLRAAALDFLDKLCIVILFLIFKLTE